MPEVAPSPLRRPNWHRLYRHRPYWHRLYRHRLYRLGVCVPLVLALHACALIDLRPVGQGGAITSGDLPKVSRIDGDRVYSLIGPDRIPAIDAPVFVTADEADFMADDEWVLGVLYEGGARAYSLWHLDRHEIVNDWLGEKPVAVTW